MSGKGNPFYMSTFKNYLNFVKIIASYYENKVITNQYFGKFLPKN